MNKTRIGGLAAGTFAVGVLTGLAGTAVARDAASTSNCDAAMAEHMNGQDLTDMMGGSMMGGSMMGAGALHEQHHPQASSEVTE